AASRAIKPVGSPVGQQFQYSSEKVSVDNKTGKTVGVAGKGDHADKGEHFEMRSVGRPGAYIYSPEQILGMQEAAAAAAAIGALEAVKQQEQRKIDSNAWVRKLLKYEIGIRKKREDRLGQQLFRLADAAGTLSEEDHKAALVFYDENIKKKTL